MQRPAFPPEVRGAFDLSAVGTIWNALRFALRIFSGKNIYNFAILENPRLRSNESPSGAFKRQSGLRKQMEGLCPDKLRRLFRTPKL